MENQIQSQINHNKTKFEWFTNERQTESQITIALGVALKQICSPNEM